MLQLGCPGRTLIGRLITPEGFPHKLDWSKVNVHLRDPSNWQDKETMRSWNNFQVTEMVLGTARWLVNNAADAADVFQAVFLSLAPLAKSIRQGQSVPNWLYTTTCRISARAWKRRVVSIENAPEPGTATTPETDLVWRQVRTALDEELQR
jgi:hypothetical protein